jgi:hypothetical protein
LGPFIAPQKANHLTKEESIVIRSKPLDRNQLFARLDDIKSRTKSSIEISRRLVEQSFLRFKATHRNLYAAQRSHEQLNALPDVKNSAAVSHERPNLGKIRERPEPLHSAGIETKLTCDHCEGILLNNKAYLVRTQEHGLILLNMIVCYACHLEAKNLGLKTDELQATDTGSQLTLRKTQVLASACLD